MSGPGRPALQLVWSRREQAVIGKVRLEIAAELDASRCDAVVLEEDTWQVLAAGPEPAPCSEHPIRLWTGLLEAKPLVPGTVLQREGRPLTLVAVVYDFDVRPCCRSRWVTAALEDIFRICRERHVRSLHLPLPAVRHGRFSARKALRHVLRAIGEGEQGVLNRVLLQCPAGEEDRICHMLAAET